MDYIIFEFTCGEVVAAEVVYTVNMVLPSGA